MAEVFLTGGTGLIGSHVAERLRGRGDGVVALVRGSSDTRHLERLGCRLVVGDLLDAPEVMAERMRGCEAVVHAAATVFQPVTRAQYLRVNVEGTERVMAAAALASPRVIHLSSVAVYSGLAMERPLTEERWTEANPERQHAYAASKHLSERAAWGFHERSEIRLTTVRPSVVYGERDRAATPLMVRYASLPLVPLVGGGRSTLPLVYAGNVADGVVAALDREATVGRAYNVALDVPITGRRLLRLLSSELGRRARIVPVPGAPLRLVARAMDGLVRLTPGVRSRDLTRAARSLTRDNPYDSARARLELGWTGLVPHEEGVRRTMEWWRSGRSLD